MYLCTSQCGSNWSAYIIVKYVDINWDSGEKVQRLQKCCNLSRLTILLLTLKAEKN